MCGQNMKVFDFYCLSLLCCFYMFNLDEQALRIAPGDGRGTVPT